MVHVRYDESMLSSGSYNRKRKEICIHPLLNVRQKIYVWFHEFLHYIIDITPTPKISDKIFDYLVYGWKYFGSFQSFQKRENYGFYLLVGEIELYKRLLENLGNGSFERAREKIRKYT